MTTNHAPAVSLAAVAALLATLGLTAMTAQASPRAAIPPRPGVATPYSPGIDYPTTPTAGIDHEMWFLTDLGVGRITTKGNIRHWAKNWTSSPDAIAAGPENSMWFDADGIGRITANGTLHRYGKNGVGATSMAANGNTLWFTTGGAGYASGSLGTITVSPHKLTIKKRRPKAVSNAFDIVKGPDGAMWFIGRRSIERVTSSWHVTTYRTPGAQPTSLASSGGWLWFTIGNAVARLSPSTGKIYLLQGGYSKHPHGITPGSHGGVWFIAGGRIDSFSKTLKFHATTVKVSRHGAGEGAPPQQLAVAPGGVWFTWDKEGDDASGLALLGSKGHVQWFRPGIDDPESIVSAADHLWVADDGDSTIDRVTTSDDETVFDIGPLDYGCSAEAGCGRGDDLDGLAAAPDHSVWGYSDDNNVLYHFSPSGAVTKLEIAAMGTNFQEVTGIAVASDGSVWMTRSPDTQGDPGGAILHVTGRHVSVYVGPHIVWPSSIAAGPSGTMWVTESGEQPSGGGAPTGTGITEVSSTDQFTTFTGTTGAEVGDPGLITRGPGGAMWFATTVGSTTGLARITTAGDVTDFLTAQTKRAYMLADGPDGALWFVTGKPGISSVVRSISNAGVVTSYQAHVAEVEGMVAGPDKSMWLTNEPSFNTDEPETLVRITTTATT